MSLKYRNNNGIETPISGLNGTSGELVPSVTYMQSGTYTPASSVQAQEDLTFSVVFTTPMPDANYLVDWWYGDSLSGVLQVAIRSRTATGFSGVLRNVGSTSIFAQNCAFDWIAFKPITDEQVRLDEAAIQELQAVVPSDASSSNKLVTESVIPTKEINDANLAIPPKAGTSTFLVSSSALHIPYAAYGYITSYCSGTTVRQIWYRSGGNLIYSRSIEIDTNTRAYVSTNEDWQQLATTTLPTLNGTCKGLADSECYATFDVTFDSWGGSSPAIIGIAADGAYVNSKALIMVNNTIESNSNKKVCILYADGVNCLFRVFAMKSSLYSNTIKVYVAFYTVATDDYSFKVQQRDYIGTISNLVVTNNSSGMPVSSWFQSIAQPSAPVLTTDLTSSVTSGSTAPVQSSAVYNALPVMTFNMANGNNLILSMSSTAYRKLCIYRDNDYYEVVVYEWGTQCKYHWIVGDAFPSDFTVSYSGYRLSITCNNSTWRILIEAPDGRDAISSYT